MTTPRPAFLIALLVLGCGPATDGPKETKTNLTTVGKATAAGANRSPKPSPTTKPSATPPPTPSPAPTLQPFGTPEPTPTETPSPKPTTAPTTAPSTAPTTAPTVAPSTPSPSPSSSSFGDLEPVKASTGLVPGALADAWGAGNQMVVDVANSVVWVDSKEGVTKLTTAGVPVTVVRPAVGSIVARQLALDAKGNLWVADNFSLCLTRITPEGAIFRSKNLGVGSVTTVAVGPDGTVFVAGGSNEVLRFGPDGKKGASIPLEKIPDNLAIDKKGALWALQPTLEKALQLEPTKAEVTVKYPSLLVADGVGALWTRTPQGVARIFEGKATTFPDVASSLFTADVAGTLWASDGTRLLKVGADGQEKPPQPVPGGTIRAVAAASDGKVYVLGGDYKLSAY